MYIKKFYDLLKSLEGQNCQLLKYIYGCLVHYYSVRACSIYAAFWVVTFRQYIIFLIVAIGIFYPMVTSIMEIVFHIPVDISTPASIPELYIEQPPTAVNDILLSKETKIITKTTSYDFIGIGLFLVPIFVILL